MNRRFQFSLKWLFVAVLVMGAFFGGIQFQRERQRREDERQYELDLLGQQSGFVDISGRPTPEEMTAILTYRETNKELMERLDQLADAVERQE